MATTPADPCRLRVLVVEDNRDAADVLALLLRLWGHEAEVVRTGAAALEAVAAFRPDVALVDILLPDLDGYQLAARLPREPRAAPVLIAMTGLSDEAHRRRSAEAGFEKHLVKPVDPLVLQEMLERLALQKQGGGGAGPGRGGSPALARA